MSGDREATSEQSSSVCEGASYDEVNLSGCELMEDLTWSPKREPSAHSFTEEEKKEYEGGEEEEVNEEEEKEEEEREEEESDDEGQAEGDGAITDEQESFLQQV